MIHGSGRSDRKRTDYPLQYSWASLVVQKVKNPPAMQETWVLSLWEDSLEKGWLPTPIFWPGEFHEQRSLAGYSPCSHKKLDMTERLSIELFNNLINIITLRRHPVQLSCSVVSDSL